MVDPTDLSSFPEELLINIFEYCDVQSLGRLAQTCRRFQHIIYTVDSCWRTNCTRVICSNMLSNEMQIRSQPDLSSRRKCEVSSKWERGYGVKNILVRYSRCMPWLALEKNSLFYSKERSIVRHPRHQDGNLINVNNKNVIKFVPHTDDVSKFVINGDEIVTVGRDGTLGRFRKADFRRVHPTRMAHSSEIHCVDYKSNIIVSGARDSCVKIWRAFPDYIKFEKRINMNVRVLSVAIMPSRSCFLVGLPGINDIHPLQLFDFENNPPVNMGLRFRNGAGILDICPESDHTFLCCGYDTTVKLWDIRSPTKFVASWMDPFDNGLYCVQTDYNFTIVSGASRSGLVHVWDKRKPGDQFVHMLSEHNSPAYSVAFDAAHLFVAYDTAVAQYSYLW